MIKDCNNILLDVFCDNVIKYEHTSHRTYDYFHVMSLLNKHYHYYSV